MSMYAKPDGSMARHPSVTHLAKVCALTRNTVRRALSELLDTYHLAPIGQDSWGAKQYWLVIPEGSEQYVETVETVSTPVDNPNETGQMATRGVVKSDPLSGQMRPTHPSGTGSSSPLAHIIELTSRRLGTTTNGT